MIAPSSCLIFIKVITNLYSRWNIKSLTILIDGILRYPATHNAVRMMIVKDNTNNSIDIGNVYLAVTVYVAIQIVLGKYITGQSKHQP